MFAGDILLKEFDQQYQQYRHLDNLRERYIAFYIAFVVAVFVFFANSSTLPNQNQLLSLILIFLLIIGSFVLTMSISMRIVQGMTGNHLMEIRKVLLKMLSAEDTMKVFDSYLMATYEPPKNDKWIQCGWNWKESAIQLILLLIIINSIIGTYLIKINTDCSIWIFVVFIIPQLLFFLKRFKSAFSSKKQDERKAKLREFLQE